MDDTGAYLAENRRRLGASIRRTREAQGLSLTTLALMAGVDRAHIWRVEQAREGITVDALGKLAAALGVPVRELVDF